MPHATAAPDRGGEEPSASRGFRIGSAGDGALAAWLSIATVLLLLADHLPRFYQGDSTTYFSTDLSRYVPLDRSWLYGVCAQWLLVASRSAGSLAAVQAAMLAGGLFALHRAVRGWGARPAAAVEPAAAGMPAARGMPAAAGMPAVVPMLLVLDPLNQTYARFWLTDAPAAALFLLFLACVPPRGGRGARIATAAAAFVLAAGTVFLRVAYLPVMLGTIGICLLASFRPGGGAAAPRRRLLVLAMAPVLGTVLLGLGNARVALPPDRGRFFINRMSGLYTMGVFLPALRIEDFRRAGMAVTPDEFAALRLGEYGRREVAVWWDGPGYVRWWMQRRLHAGPEDPGFERRCRLIVRSALLHHPWDLLAVYGRSTPLYLEPREWGRGFRTEMGFDRALPDWVIGVLRWRTGEAVPADLNTVGSPLPELLRHVIRGYPPVLLLGLAAAVGLLRRRRPLDGADLLAAALLASFAAAPLYSHAVKPRYVLATVLLAEWLVGAVAADAVRTRWRNR